MTDGSAAVGLIGLAVMGENLALNMERRGFSVAIYNRSPDKVKTFLAGRGQGRRFVGAASLAELVAAVARPRRILMMVRAGSAVDELIDALVPLLDRGDILIDGGNSLHTDTARRRTRVEAAGMLFVGTGVSGGEEGALTGPSLMPGGSPAAWPQVREVFQAICARTPEGVPCCDWIGDGGAGHFVKMVHNGIEYGDMQLIAEIYDLMRRAGGLGNDEMSAVFADWNRGELDSYLVEITRDILAFREPDGTATLDRILDSAGQKGTGRWTVAAALDDGQPLSLIGEAVFARFLSAATGERLTASALLRGPEPVLVTDRDAFIADLRAALYAAKIVSYAQGFQLMRAAAHHGGFSLDYGAVALVWRGGCIIRSAFLGDIKRAFVRDPDLPSVLLDPFFRDAIAARLPGWRRALTVAIAAGIPVPCLGAALAYYDGYRSARLPANLTQAQRDYFGAHTYERIDRPRGETFHTDWTGHGGATTSRAYSA